MKTTLILGLTLLFAGCALSHKRGPEVQATVDYYVNNRGDLPAELTKAVSKSDFKEADVTVQWTVNEKGETQDVSIEHDTLHNELVNSMILDHLRTMKFPKTPRFTKTTVEYTYKFKMSKNP